ncbi:hypothetical protein [Halovenus sp. HT40]|uniref:hypothetical protein n=1 Tax=Halovenus sp. HT40 TaxID=3126691 RepID=UPI00300F5C7C
MSNGVATENTATVEWRPLPADRLDAPLVWTGPYVECKLEYPILEPTCLGDQFFPDSIPYESDTEHRVFYWRRRFPDVFPRPERWTGVCATTHELAALTADSSHTLSLTQSTPEGDELVVDGTIVGDSKTALVSECSPPTVELRRASDEAVELALDGESARITAGDRERIELSRRVVETEYGSAISATPELTVRFPGRRTIYHPGEEYCLFPPFGLDLAEIPNPLEVPTARGELDHDRLASAVGIDIAARPYPERILWQAFAVTAFDPHATTAEIAQFPSGELAVRS